MSNVEKQHVSAARGKKNLLSRREFIRHSLIVAAGAVLASACESDLEPDNSALEVTLQRILGITHDTTRDQLAADAAKYMNDPSWHVNTSVGVYHARNRVDIPIALDAFGQLATINFDANDKDQLAAYKSFESLKYPHIMATSKESVFQITGQSGKKIDTHAIVYGTSGSINRFGDQVEEMFKVFLQEAFDTVDTPHISLHLNFLPPGLVQYKDLGEQDYTPPDDSFGAHMHITPHSETQTLPLRSLDIYLNLYTLHREALLFGQTYSELFRQTWTNEMDGLHGRLDPDFDLSVPYINEAHSTLVSWLALLDPSVATLVLNGSAYDVSANTLGAEMDVLAEIGS